MPSKSAKQHRLMAMVAHDPKAAKRLDIPQSVGRDYVEADKGRKFGSGGSMKESKAMMRKELSFMKKKGAPKSMIKHEETEMKSKKFAAGGITDAQRAASRQRIATKLGREYQGYKPGGDPRAAQSVVMANAPRSSTPAGGFGSSSGGMGAAGRTTLAAKKGGIMKSGSASRRADGIASKGKTRGKMVKMAYGGKC